FLDSGALYRLLALAAERRGIALDDEARLASLAGRLDVRFPPGDGVYLDGEQVEAAIRTETCGNAASRVAVLPAVRSALLERQRSFRQPPGLVADGRDMGTVVFAHAPVKIFLTASAEERAKRRYKQLKEKGLDANLASLVDEIAERDRRDANRSVAPLKPAPDAHVVDTTALDIDGTVARVREIVAAWMDS
ncbi:MAG TPA: (d)CMP kinase, partial [Gammaproteobacteria bacterium]|nr:(d)CMP kinase [Gammaproteobacteria bacterium]